MADLHTKSVNFILELILSKIQAKRFDTKEGLEIMGIINSHKIKTNNEKELSPREMITLLEEGQQLSQDSIRNYAKILFPEGSIVYFQKWGGEIRAEILRFNSGFGLRGPSFFIQSHTGKKYNVSLYDLLNY